MSTVTIAATGERTRPLRVALIALAGVSLLAGLNAGLLLAGGIGDAAGECQRGCHHGQGYGFEHFHETSFQRCGQIGQAARLFIVNICAISRV